MDVRGSSTALDAVLFVLLVGAAIAVLSGADAGEAGGDPRVAAETADVLTTSTTELTYTQSLRLETGVFGSNETRSVTAAHRAEGTYAEHLASAVTAAPTVAGIPLVTADGGLSREVENVTRFALPTRDANVRARAVWRPFDGAGSGGELVVGDGPPPDVDVAVATASVPSGFPNVTTAARRGGRSDGFDGVASAAARGIVDGLFPPVEVRTALHSEGPDLGVVVARYRHASNALDVDVAEMLERREVREANDALADALADELRDELARDFDSPRAAAAAVRIHRVQVVVRAWSR